MATLKHIETTPSIEKPNVRLFLGDCLEVIRGLPANSIDACITDPPYGLKFMGRKWDYDVPGEDVWRECLRVLKPGSILLSFGGTRTYHRMVCPIEDAGFFVEDSIHWVYGSGFPKHKSKLKPAHEPIVLARKSGGAKWLNVDGCRVDSGERPNREADRGRITGNAFEAGLDGSLCGSRAVGTTTAGRWPANLCLSHSPGCVRRGTKRVKSNARDDKGACGGYDVGMTGKPRGSWGADVNGTEIVADYDCADDCPIRLMGEQGGIRKSGAIKESRRHPDDQRKNWRMPNAAAEASEGTAARFFPNFDADPFLYCPKASRKDRGEDNKHPTVKPIALMRWLCRLATPPDGTVLDPFAGSGSTGVAAIEEGFGFIGIELDPEYHRIAESRIRAAQSERAAI